MNRIDELFNRLKKEKRKGLITYLMAGDPDLTGTEELARTMLENGVDLLEIGIPFSDPVAEGPVIQAASHKALQQGYHLKDYFNMVKNLRKVTNAPLVFMNYYNPVLKMGEDAFFHKCAEAGIDGVIIPDLPYEESRESVLRAKQQGVYLISMVAPTSRERTSMVAGDAKGFLYCLSSRGVTGVRNTFDSDSDAFFEQVAEISPIPTAIGFGIGSAEQVGQLKDKADALIIGSAVVRIISESSDISKAKERLRSFVGEIRQALDE